jgi:hypothetical protein
MIQVYGFKLCRSGDNTFILALAVAYMIMVSIGIPFELLETRFPLFIGEIEPVCKLILYLEGSITASGGALTVLIALDIGTTKLTSRCLAKVPSLEQVHTS